MKLILVPSIYDKTKYRREPVSLYGADDYIEEHDLSAKLIDAIKRIQSGAPAETEPAQQKSPMPSSPRRGRTCSRSGRAARSPSRATRRPAGGWSVPGSRWSCSTRRAFVVGAGCSRAITASWSWAERLYDVREAYALSLDEGSADDYRAAFDRRAKQRFGRYAAFLDEA